MAKILGKIASGFLDLVETIAISLSIFLVVYLFLMQPHQVNGQSMIPNFQNGEHVMTDKISYKFREPIRGEVVVFHAPPAAGCVEGTGCDFIKRIIAIPGDQ
jgi:signal peptidase I